MQIQAMLANETDITQLIQYCEDEHYWMEQKLDGHRILLDFHDGEVVAKERAGKISQHNAKFQTPLWKNISQQMENRSFVLDGEYISGDYWVFDTPYGEGLITPDDPYDMRRAVLGAMAKKLGFNLVPTAKTTDEKLDLVERCIKNHAEGVMIKRSDGKYHSGLRTNDCLKGKFTKTADVVVTAKGIAGKDNMVLCVWKDEQLVEIGHCSAIGKPHVEVGEVIEVKYLYFGSNNKLVQPTMLKKRPDKTMQECEFGQLIHTNKEVLT